MGQLFSSQTEHRDVDVELAITLRDGAVYCNVAQPSNKVVTSKYTWYNFLPKNLSHQLASLANLYFVFIGVLQIIPLTSTSHGIPTIYMPLMCILLVGAVRAAIEDMSIHRSDAERNHAMFWQLKSLSSLDLSDSDVEDIKHGVGTTKSIQRSGSEGATSPLLEDNSRRRQENPFFAQFFQNIAFQEQNRLSSSSSSDNLHNDSNTTNFYTWTNSIPVADTVHLPGLQLSKEDSRLAYEALKPSRFTFLSLLGFGGKTSPASPTRNRSLTTTSSSGFNASSDLMSSSQDDYGGLLNHDTTSVELGLDETARENNAITARKNIIAENEDFSLITSGTMQVGSIVKIYKDQMIPADMILLGTSEQRNHCFIDKANLNGETQLEVMTGLPAFRRYFNHVSVGQTSIPTGGDANQANIHDLQFHLTYEQSNPNFEQFRCTLRAYNAQYPSAPPIVANISAKQLLLRETVLRNSDYIYGLVVYTGSDTKIRKSVSDESTRQIKVSRLMRKINSLVAYMFVIQLLLCLFGGIYNGIWSYRESAQHWYLDLDADTSTVLANSLWSVFSWMILANTFVPISLLVSAEMAKFMLTIYIEWDLTLFDAKIGKGAKCNTSVVHDDLGLVDYIFSDKTGTLTQNKMELRFFSVAIQPESARHRVVVSHNSHDDDNDTDIPRIALQDHSSKSEGESSPLSNNNDPDSTITVASGSTSRGKRTSKRGLTVTHGVAPLSTTSLFECFGNLETEIAISVRNKMLQQQEKQRQRQLERLGRKKAPVLDHSYVRRKKVQSVDPESPFSATAYEQLPKRWTDSLIGVAANALAPVSIEAIRKKVKNQQMLGEFGRMGRLIYTTQGGTRQDYLKALELFYVRQKRQQQIRRQEQLHSTVAPKAGATPTAVVGAGVHSTDLPASTSSRTLLSVGQVRQQQHERRRTQDVIPDNHSTELDNLAPRSYQAAQPMSSFGVASYLSRCLPDEPDGANIFDNNAGAGDHDEQHPSAGGIPPAPLERSLSSFQDHSTTSSFSMHHFQSPSSPSHSRIHRFPAKDLHEVTTRLEFQRKQQFDRDYVIPASMLGAFGPKQRQVVLTALWSSNWDSVPANGPADMATPSSPSTYVAPLAVRLSLLRYLRHLALSSTVKAYRKQDNSLDWQFESAEELAMVRFAASCGFIREVHPSGVGTVLYIREYLTPEFTDAQSRVWAEVYHNISTFGFSSRRSRVTLVWQRIPDAKVFGYSAIENANSPSTTASSPSQTNLSPPTSSGDSTGDVVSTTPSGTASGGIPVITEGCLDSPSTVNAPSVYLSSYDPDNRHFGSEYSSNVVLSNQGTIYVMAKGQDTTMLPLVKDVVPDHHPSSTISGAGAGGIDPSSSGGIVRTGSHISDYTSHHHHLSSELVAYDNPHHNIQKQLREMQGNGLRVLVAAYSELEPVWWSQYETIYQYLADLDQDDIIPVTSLRELQQMVGSFPSHQSAGSPDSIGGASGGSTQTSPPPASTTLSPPQSAATTAALSLTLPASSASFQPLNTSSHSKRSAGGVTAKYLRHKLYEEIEKNAGLALLGCIGMEDKLQELVPETIRDMRRSGVRVWMITGDKLETAKNIALACELIDADMMMNEQQQQQQQQDLDSLQSLGAVAGSPLTTDHAGNSQTAGGDSMSIATHLTHPDSDLPLCVKITKSRRLIDVTGEWLHLYKNKRSAILCDIYSQLNEHNIATAAEQAFDQHLLFEEPDSDDSACSTSQVNSVLAAAAPLTVGYLHRCLARLGFTLTLQQVGILFVLEPQDVPTYVHHVTKDTPITSERFVNAFYAVAETISERESIEVDIEYGIQTYSDLQASYLQSQQQLESQQHTALPRDNDEHAEPSQRKEAPPLSLLVNRNAFNHIFTVDQATVLASEINNPSSNQPLQLDIPTLSASDQEQSRLPQDVQRTTSPLLSPGSPDSDDQQQAGAPAEPNSALQRQYQRLTRTQKQAELPLLARKFFILSTLCKSVVFARAEPAMKKKMVTSIHQVFPQATTLAIGDGSNDTEMITAASVGVGLAGVEGTAASNSADYSFPAFRMLHTLLLVHGNYSYGRISKLVYLMFYKASMLAFCHFMFGFNSAFSGQQLYNDFLYQLYNTIYTSWCVLLVGGMSAPLPTAQYENSPALYRETKSTSFSYLQFFSWLLRSFLHSLWIYYIPFLCLRLDGNELIGSFSLLFQDSTHINPTDPSMAVGKTTSFWYYSTIQFCALSVLPNVMSIFLMENITLIFAVIIFFSAISVFMFVALLQTMAVANGDIYLMFLPLFRNPQFYLLFFLSLSMPIIAEITIIMLTKLFYSPTIAQVLKERIYLRKQEYDRLFVLHQKQTEQEKKTTQAITTLSSSTTTAAAAERPYNDRTRLVDSDGADLRDAEVDINHLGHASSAPSVAGSDATFYDRTASDALSTTQPSFIDVQLGGVDPDPSSIHYQHIFGEAGGFGVRSTQYEEEWIATRSYDHTNKLTREAEQLLTKLQLDQLYSTSFIPLNNYQLFGTISGIISRQQVLIILRVLITMQANSSSNEHTYHSAAQQQYHKREKFIYTNNTNNNRSKKPTSN